jgi:hypothetical protein
MDELVDDTPDIGRQTLLENPEFSPMASTTIRDTPTPNITHPLVSIVNADKFYHGSKVQNLDLGNIDPIAGGSRNEFGPGIYLTNNSKLAEDYAKAGVHRNVPMLDGRTFDEVGSVYEVTTSVKNPVDAALPPPKDVREAFVHAASNAGSIDPYIRKTFNSWAMKADVPLSQFWAKMDELVNEFYGNSTPFPEAGLLNWQRQVNTNIRNLGYDAVVHLGNNPAVDKTVVMLGGVPGNNLAAGSRRSVGNGELLEQAAARFNTTQHTFAQNPDNAFSRVDAQEASTTLQSRLLQQTIDNYELATREVDLATDAVIQTEKELRDFVKAEQPRLEAQRQLVNDRRNQTAADHHGAKDDGWCF